MLLSEESLLRLDGQLAKIDMLSVRRSSRNNWP